VTRRGFVIAVLFGALAATPLGAEPPDLSLRAVEAAARDRSLSREAIGEGPGAVLAEAAGIEAFPLPCATPLLAHEPASSGTIGAVQPGGALRQAKAILMARPGPAGRRFTLTEDGGFVVSFPAQGGAGLMAADRDGDGLPDLVNRVAEVLQASRSHLAGLGYPDPVPPGGRREVHLLRLGRGLEGYVVVPRTADGGLSQAEGAFAVLDANLDSDRLGAAVIHQMAHLSLASLVPADAPPWWAEATAVFLTFAATGDIDGLRPHLEARQNAAGRCLATDDLLLMQGGVLWPMFLAERTGDPAVVRRIWEVIAAAGLDPAQAAARVLRDQAGLSLPGAQREFAAWNLFTGERDDGLHYSLGSHLPQAPLPVVGPGLPLDLGPVEPVEGLGSVAFRLPSDGATGALDLSLQAEGGAPGADLLVFYRDHGARPILVPIPVGNDGHGGVSIPWDNAVEAWLILRNAAEAPEDAARFEVRASLDPFAPYDLASFTAAGASWSIVLEWTTASEKGLLGWNIYRARRPTGPFLRINGVAIPARGDGSEETGYVFVDAAVRPERRYYYLIEGLTESGLTQRSHLASARAPDGP
jgi:hypothetical protein